MIPHHAISHLKKSKRTFSSAVPEGDAFLIVETLSCISRVQLHNVLTYSWGCSVVSAPPRIKVCYCGSVSSISLDANFLIANQIDALQAIKTGGLAANQAAIDGINVHGLTIQSNLADTTVDRQYSRSRRRLHTALKDSRNSKRVLTLR